MGGRRLPYWEAGSGETIVAIVGDEPLPTRAHALLAERRRVIVFAMTADAGSPQEAARRIGAAVMALGIERFDLIGEGTGAGAAMWLALAPEADIGSVVLAGPDGLPDEAFREIKRPVLVLFGTKDQSAAGDRHRTLLPDCHFMFVYDAGPAIGAERPEAFVFIALEFFERAISSWSAGRTAWFFLSLNGKSEEIGEQNIETQDPCLLANFVRHRGRAGGDLRDRPGLRGDCRHSQPNRRGSQARHQPRSGAVAGVHRILASAPRERASGVLASARLAGQTLGQHWSPDYCSDEHEPGRHWPRRHSRLAGRRRRCCGRRSLRQHPALRLSPGRGPEPRRLCPCLENKLHNLAQNPIFLCRQRRPGSMMAVGTGLHRCDRKLQRSVPAKSPCPIPRN